MAQTTTQKLGTATSAGLKLAPHDLGGATGIAFTTLDFAMTVGA